MPNHCCACDGHASLRAGAVCGPHCDGALCERCFRRWMRIPMDPTDEGVHARSWQAATVVTRRCLECGKPMPTRAGRAGAPKLTCSPACTDKRNARNRLRSNEAKRAKREQARNKNRADGQAADPVEQGEHT